MVRLGARTATYALAGLATLLVAVAVGLAVSSARGAQTSAGGARIPAPARMSARGGVRPPARSARAAPPVRALTRAFTDDVWFDGPSWTARTVITGARLVLLEVDWASVAPDPPAPGVDPTSPNDPQYKFAYIDAVLRQFAGTGIQAAFLVSDAPTWAETAGGPSALEAAGAWKPDPTAFGQLATALARRYSGSFPDPLKPGQALPRVRYYQAWAEANINVHLSPQWILSNGQWVQTGPLIYRSLLNSFYAGIKSVHPDNVVLTSGFGPFGDLPGACDNAQAGNGCRMPPAKFLRTLLCVQGSALTPTACPNPAHFDALAMDPYEVGPPTRPAANADDATAPDLGHLMTIINKARKLGRALPRASKQLWVTEFSYDSSPPNPTAVSTATQARWLEQSFYVFWNEGVSTVVWYLLRDQAGTDYSTSYFSGVYFYNGTPKPSFEAYRFPFVVMPAGKKARAWGISPRTGSVTVQRQKGATWKTLFHVKVAAGRVFVRNISPRLHGNFRAIVGGESSLIWKG
jgi:hypothetical protein